MRSGLGFYVARALLICSIFGNFRAVSQEKFRFEYISSSNGLTSNLITGITEDQEGIYWISTANGLVSYNGFDFVHYFFAENDSTSLSHNGINTIFIDSNNKLLELPT